MADPHSKISKKRTYGHYQQMQQVHTYQIGQTFKSKADFHGYWSQCLKVSPLYPRISDPFLT